VSLPKHEGGDVVAKHNRESLTFSCSLGFDFALSGYSLQETSYGPGLLPILETCWLSKSTFFQIAACPNVSNSTEPCHTRIRKNQVGCSVCGEPAVKIWRWRCHGHP